MSQHTGSGDQSPYLPPLSSIFGDKPGLYTYLSFQFLFPHDLPPSQVRPAEGKARGWGGAKVSPSIPVQGHLWSLWTSRGQEGCRAPHW